MKNLLGCLIKYFKDLVKFNFNMNFNACYYAQFKLAQQDKKHVNTNLQQHVNTN